MIRVRFNELPVDVRKRLIAVLTASPADPRVLAFELVPVDPFAECTLSGKWSHWDFVGSAPRGVPAWAARASVQGVKAATTFSAPTFTVIERGPSTTRIGISKT